MPQRNTPPQRPLLAAVTLAFCFAAAPAYADEPQRISVEQFSKDPQKVKALTDAVLGMRADDKADPMSPAFRTSFAYWANTHGYFGTGAHATNLQQYIDYRMPQCLEEYEKKTCDAYFAHMHDTPVPGDGFTDQVWGTCQHGNLYFLPWHRIYLHYYERTLQKHAKDANLALPYWNYFDNYVPKAKGIALPPLVRGKQAGTFYNQYRTPGLNENASHMDPDSADATEAFSYSDFTSFSNQLQAQPHGAMHCAAGSGCTMPDIGFVPIAGLDPVFYMHHANIDRLWQCWMTKKAGGATIDLAWAKANLGMPDEWYEKSFTFADENGDKVVRKVADLFNGAITVNYDNLTNCDTKPPTAPVLAGTLPVQLKTGAVMRTHKAVMLNNSNVDVPLQAAPALKAGPEALVLPNDTAAEPGENYLVLENVELVGSPALTYKVLLSSKKNPKRTSYVATLSYFGLGPTGHAEHTGSANSLGTLTYKVTANLAKLGISSPDDVVVRFEPTNLMVGAKLKPQKAGNGVTVSDVRVQTGPAAP